MIVDDFFETTNNLRNSLTKLYQIAKQAASSSAPQAEMLTVPLAASVLIFTLPNIQFNGEHFEDNNNNNNALSALHKKF